jgi:hypothetical protein
MSAAIVLEDAKIPAIPIDKLEIIQNTGEIRDKTGTTYSNHCFFISINDYIKSVLTNHKPSLGYMQPKWEACCDNIKSIKDGMKVIQGPEEFFDLGGKYPDDEIVELNEVEDRLEIDTIVEIYALKQRIKMENIDEWCNSMNIRINIFTYNFGDGYMNLNSSKYGRGGFTINIINYNQTHFELITTPFCLEAQLKPYKPAVNLLIANKIEIIVPITFTPKEKEELISEYKITNEDFDLLLSYFKELGLDMNEKQKIADYIPDILPHLKQKQQQEQKQKQQQEQKQKQQQALKQKQEQEQQQAQQQPKQPPQQPQPQKQEQQQYVKQQQQYVKQPRQPQQQYVKRFQHQRSQPFQQQLQQEFQQQQLQQQFQQQQLQQQFQQQQLEQAYQQQSKHSMFSKKNNFHNKYLKYKHKYYILKNKLN